MILMPDDILVAADGEGRWRIRSRCRDLETAAYTALWKVEDLAPGLDGRTLHALTLDYESLDAEQLKWDITGLRAAFERTARALSSNHPFLPEPVDYLTFFNRRTPMPEAAREREPALIFALPEGRPVFRRNRRLDLGALRRICLAVAHRLAVLHQDKLIIRHLPPPSLIESSTTGNVLVARFDALCPMQRPPNYNPHAPDLHPARAWAAPECFDPHGYLSPATDIYALGVTLLAFLGEILPPSAGPAAVLAAVQRLRLPELWRRFFVIALQRDPRDRFHDARALLAFVHSDGAESSGGVALGPRVPILERPDLPRAVVVFCPDHCGRERQSLDVNRVLAHFQGRYSLSERWAVTHRHADVDGNPFYRVLVDRLHFGLTAFEPDADVVRMVNDRLRDSLFDAQALIVVGHGGLPAIQAALCSPAATGRTVHFVCAGGPIPADVDAIDGRDFVRKEKR